MEAKEKKAQLDKLFQELTTVVDHTSLGTETVRLPDIIKIMNNITKIPQKEGEPGLLYTLMTKNYISWRDPIEFPGEQHVSNNPLHVLAQKGQYEILGIILNTLDPTQRADALMSVNSLGHTVRSEIENSFMSHSVSLDDITKTIKALEQNLGDTSLFNNISLFNLFVKVKQYQGASDPISEIPLDYLLKILPKISVKNLQEILPKISADKLQKILPKIPGNRLGEILPEISDEKLLNILTKTSVDNLGEILPKFSVKKLQEILPKIYVTKLQEIMLEIPVTKLREILPEIPDAKLQEILQGLEEGDLEEEDLEHIVLSIPVDRLIEITSDEELANILKELFDEDAELPKLLPRIPADTFIKIQSAISAKNLAKILPKIRINKLQKILPNIPEENIHRRKKIRQHTAIN